MPFPLIVRSLTEIRHFPLQLAPDESIIKNYAKHAIDSIDAMGYIDLMKKANNTDPMGSIIIRDIDETVRKKFRLMCIEANVSMNAVLKDWIAAVVQKGKLK